MGLFEFAEAYAQSLKQAAPPQAESPKDEVDYNECCCEDGYKMICPQHGAPQTLAVGHGVDTADDCAHRALDRLGVPRDGKGLYLRMQWLKDQIPKPIYPQYGTTAKPLRIMYGRVRPRNRAEYLALTEPVADPSKEELVIEIARELYDRFVMGGWEPQDAYPKIRKWLRSSSSEC